MAQFDDSQIAKPQFKPVPGGAKLADGQPADGKAPPAKSHARRKERRERARKEDGRR